jgi:hypothetical protein
MTVNELRKKLEFVNGDLPVYVCVNDLARDNDDYMRHTEDADVQRQSSINDEHFAIFTSEPFGW